MQSVCDSEIEIEEMEVLVKALMHENNKIKHLEYVPWSLYQKLTPMLRKVLGGTLLVSKVQKCSLRR